ncbi:hypothetical protein A1O1_07986 [Capronia coronata CBS 617.96]|uniref:MHD domain-containing protein n=1 Tax=Capronia coronata CBS 617.96 TaxID=1182541 RepID=W9YI11_9EURO|nr:uncharacterized protein A1O1_07986 [Capronia coronata CBS 617.96]EXJ81919.1 hypothetical protein A1O1_07986 [Capronia coronata CBS 617.96]
MELSRTEYPTLLASLQPEQAITVLNDRVAVISKINDDIADWLYERRKVEEAYVAGLRKLARRPQQVGATTLGIFQMPWQRIVSGTENLAASHETLAAKIESDVENPLRNFASRNREMQALVSTQGNLNAIAKELVNAQKKASKGGRRADNASSAAEDAARQWETQAPYVFEQLQALDETRINHLRDVLTQFQTHEVDAIEKNRLSAESCLNALLNIETADEIKTFAAKNSEGRALRRHSSATASARPASSQNRVPPTPPPPRHADDRHTQRSNSAAGQDTLTPLPETPHKEKHRLGGLKRLGTVMGRRKSVVPPAPPQSHSTEEKRRTRSFAPFRRGDSSRSFQDLEETGEDLIPSISRDDRPTSSISHDRHHAFPTPTEREAPLAIPNGVTASQAPLESNAELAPTQPALLDTGGSSQTQAPPFHSWGEQPRSPSSAAPESPFAGAAADESSRNFMIRDKPIQEDESEAQLAMNNMANQLRTQAQNSGLNRVQGSTRGRRDVRNTMYVPSQAEPFGASASAPRPRPAVSIPAGSGSSDNVLASPIQRPLAPGIVHEDHGLGSDTTSIHSSRSLVGPSQHVDLHEPGLNASVVETVHSWFTETGITKSFVLGEVAFAYNGSASSDSDHEIVRLLHFERLDKIAANPIFLTQVKSTGESMAEEQAGSYTLTTQPIRRPTPMIGLKYQLHIDESNLGRYSPVLVTPAWQIVEGQVSVIVLYSLNPVFGSEPLSLKNVTISVHLDTSGEGTGKAASAMMAPTQGATFRRKLSAVVWRFNELTVKPGQERLLVRFITQGGMPKKGSVELKFEIPGRTASEIGVEKLVAGGDSKDKDTDTDPFADDIGDSSARGSAEEKRWEVIPTHLKLVSGRYTAS